MDPQFNLLDAYWRAANYLTVGPDLPAAQPAPARAACGPSTSSRACSATGGRRPGLNLVYVHLNRLIRERDANVIFLAGPGHGGPAMLANVYLEGTYSRDLPGGHARTTTGIAAALPAVLDAGRRAEPREPADAGLDPRRRRARLRAHARVRRGVRQPRSARGRASSATARPRPGRSRARGRASASSTRRATARCCRSCTSTATRSPARRCSAAPTTTTIRQLARRPRLRRASSSRATSRCDVHAAFAATLDACVRDDPRRSRTTARARRHPRRPRVAGDRAAHAEGLDRARRSSTACRSRARSARTRCRSPGVRDEPGAPRDARSAGCAAIGPRSSSTRRAGSSRELAGARTRRASAGWARTRTPTAEAADVPLDLPDYADYAVDVPTPGDRAARVDAPARRAACATSSSQPRRDELPAVLSRRDQLEPARRGVRGREPLLRWSRSLADRRSRVAATGA